MTRPTPRSNRGPAAAAQNRAALLGSAQKLFREQGYNVPLSAIARDAGVGQGVLYRHFPTRLALAFAVFEGDFEEYQRLSDSPEPKGFFRLWHALVDNLIGGTAFVDMVIDARKSHPEYDGIARLRAILASPLARATDAGLVGDVSVDDVVLAIRMAYGIIRTSAGQVPEEDVRQTVLESFPHLRGPVGVS